MNKSMKYLPSLGGGYGINRNVSAESALGVAEPPLARGATRNPGSPNRKAIGQQGLKSFSGAKGIGAKKR